MLTTKYQNLLYKYWPWKGTINCFYEKNLSLEFFLKCGILSQVIFVLFSSSWLSGGLDAAMLDHC